MIKSYLREKLGNMTKLTFLNVQILNYGLSQEQDFPIVCFFTYQNVTIFLIYCINCT